MMKICEYIPTASFFVGGGEVYPLMQARALANSHDVTLVLLKTDYESEYFKRYKQVTHNLNYTYLESAIEKEDSFTKGELNHDRTHELYYSLSRSFMDLCAKEKFDIVVVHYGPGAVSVPSSTKEILFMHGTPSVYQPINYAAVRIADSLVAVSKSISQEWQQLFNFKKNIKVLYNAVDTDIFHSKPGVDQDIDIFYVGRLIEIKGLQDLLNSLAILKKKYKLTPTLYIAGKGPLEEKLRIQSKTNQLQDQVRFLGYVDEKDKLSLYNRSKICVFPSYAKEGVLTTMLEAAACQKAVITCNCCGMVDFLKDNINGLLVDPQNPADLAEKIRLCLIDDKLRKRLGEKARDSVIAKWNWDYHVKMFEELLVGK